MSIATRALVVTLALLSFGVFSLATAGRSEAVIHEMIGAACRAGGEEVVPPGQIEDGQSFLRALQATGLIESIDTSVPGQVTINFDLDQPNAKYISAGFDLTLEDELGPGVDLILSPLPVLDPDFAAHANCENLNP